MANLDLGGAMLPITSPSGQPIEVLFDFGTVDVSGWTWLGQVRAKPESTEVLAVRVHQPVADRAVGDT